VHHKLKIPASGEDFQSRIDASKNHAAMIKGETGTERSTPYQLGITYLSLDRYQKGHTVLGALD
jgi:hypothetical protein